MADVFPGVLWHPELTDVGNPSLEASAMVDETWEPTGQGAPAATVELSGIWTWARQSARRSYIDVATRRLSP